MSREILLTCDNCGDQLNEDKALKEGWLILEGKYLYTNEKNRLYFCGPWCLKKWDWREYLDDLVDRLSIHENETRMLDEFIAIRLGEVE